MRQGRSRNLSRCVRQMLDVFDNRRNELLDGHIQHRSGFDIDVLGIGLVLDSIRDSSSFLVKTPYVSNSLTALSVVRAGIASTMDARFGSPLLFASCTQDSE